MLPHDGREVACVSEELTPAEGTGPAAVLDPSLVAPVFAAVHAGTPEVRLALFEALIRLPLDPSDWSQLCDYATWAIDSKESAAERSGVVEAAPYLPVRAFRERVAQVAGDPADPDHLTAARGLAIIGDARAAPARAAQGGPVAADVGTKLAPAWAAGTPAGFTPHSDSELEAARSRLAASDVLKGAYSDLDMLDELPERQPDPFEVTALFELAGAHQMFAITLRNQLVRWIGRFQREFRPDALGLFREYARREHDRIHWYRWQIAWAVSRGGLRGLVAELAPALESPDPDDPIAAGHLIADAADYVLEGSAPQFGGETDGPPGPAVVIEEVEAWGGARGELMAEPPEELMAEPPEGEAGDAAPSGEEVPQEHGRRTRGLEFPEVEENGDVAPPKKEDRWILAQAYDATDPVHPAAVERAFRAGAPHLVQVQVGPERADMMRATGGPAIDEVLPADGTAHDLVLVFVPPAGNEVQSAPVTLPPTGPTEMLTFQFRAGPAGVPLEAQIVVLYQNRVLQTAVLRGQVVDDPAAAPDAAVELTLAVIRPGMADLEARSRFDSAVVVSHTPQGKPAAAGVHDEKVSRFDSDGIDRAAQKITSILTDLADNPDKYAPPLDSEGNVGLIRQLTFQGVELFNAMGRFVVQDMGGEDLAAIQVLVSDPNDLVPVEFVYDLPAPTLDAGLCPNWRTALDEGRCDPANHPVDGTGLATVVCPTGFWALSKVIERQVVDRGHPLVDLQGMDFGVRSEPNGERPHLPALTSALFGASQRVDRVKDGLTDQVLATLNELTGDRAARADTWADWVQQVTTLQPPLLVLLSHTEKVQSSLALEIGAGDLRVMAQITPNVVKAAPDSAPVVLLLGCDTAVADRELQSFVSQFRDSGAALVVGTVAAVLGEHAAPVAQALTTALRDAAAAGAAGQDGPTFGAVMLDIRRKLLAGGELMSLCLATYGDADWRLSGGG